MASNKKGLQTAIWIALVAMLLGTATRFLEALAEIIRMFLN
jgi:hypothetical protein